MADDESTGPEDDADSEVLSLGMTGKDDTGGIDDEPQLEAADPDAGFDGWLGGEEGDPYRELAEQPAAAEEVADWLAFAKGETTDEPDEEESPSPPVSSPGGGGAERSEAEGAVAGLPPEGGETGAGSWAGEGEPPPGYTIKGNVDSMLYHRPDSWMYDETEAEVWFDNEPAAIAAGFNLSSTHPSDEPTADAEPPEVEEEEEEDEEDTSEFDIPTFDEETGEVPLAAPPDEFEDDATGDDLDAVVEMQAIRLEGEGQEEEEVDTEDDAGEDDDEEPAPSLDDYTAEDYIGAATQDHADLAAEIAAAEAEDTEKVALSADIPGLESGVVGFDDVVEEAGIDEEPVEEPGSSNLVLRVGTALALVAALALSLLWRPALIVFVLAVLVVAAGEFYSALIHRRFKPMSLFGFLGIAGAGLGTAAWGVGAIPISMALMATVLMLFNAVSPRRDRPAANFSVTVLVAAWIGGLGAFAFDIIAADDYQVLVISLVALVALVDIAAYLVGGRIGRRSLAPVISPKKTWEGLIAGTFTAFAVGAAIGYLVDAIDLPTGLLLGGVVAVFAPIGDLAVSVVKRSLAIKDMGSILPGHGGLLDRIDALIAVIPAAWVVLTWLALI